ncbi:MAG: LysR family transcriptional regulator [Alphaproteobacteria bacterium]|nr:MAG: LysR family transcriptional regulator [Alphaproteobacteria bacterium]
MNLRHLRAFARTVELGTLVGAANAVHISQPALTQAIARLEAALGVDFFLRQNDGMKPTAAAELFYPRVIAALSLVRSTNVTHAQLRAFWALARGGSYAEASQGTGLAPASLHRAVGDLELALGQTLVRRLGRKLELTPYGRAFSRTVKLAHAELAAGLSELDALRGEGAGSIAVGAMPLCRARILPATIVDFQREFPEFKILVAEGSHAELVDPLRDGDLDLLIGALRDPAPGRDLIQEPLFIDKPVVLGRAQHPLAAKRGRATLRDLARYEWCLPPRGVPLRERWQALFEAEGLEPPRVRVEIGSGIAIRQILINTDALTLLSPDQVALELEAEWLTMLAKTQLTRTIGLIYRADWRPTLAQRRFIETIKSHC